MDALVELSEVANGGVVGRQAQRRLIKLSMAARIISEQPKSTAPLGDELSAVAASRVRLATAAARHTWNKVLVRPK